MRGGINGRLEFFPKFICFGTATRPLPVYANHSFRFRCTRKVDQRLGKSLPILCYIYGDGLNNHSIRVILCQFRMGEHQAKCRALLWSFTRLSSFHLVICNLFCFEECTKASSCKLVIFKDLFSVWRVLSLPGFQVFILSLVNIFLLLKSLEFTRLSLKADASAPMLSKVDWASGGTPHASQPSWRPPATPKPSFWHPGISNEHKFYNILFLDWIPMARIK